MNPTLHGHMVRSSRPALRPAWLVLLVSGGLLTAATLALWARYGTAVFYETILAGIDACF